MTAEYIVEHVGHRGLSAVGDHLDRVDEVLGGGMELVETMLGRQFADRDVARDALALSFERGDLGAELDDLVQ